MINWGIIGLGNMANRFASSIKEVKNANLKGIASNSVDRLKTFGELHKIESKYRFNSYAEILKCEEINSIYISTLNNTHADIVIRAAQAKKNILCEKPVTTNYAEVLKVFEVLKKSKIFFIEAIAYRSHPQTEFVISKIKDQSIGKIKKIESTFGFFVKKIDTKSRLFNPDLGGGAILDVGCYPVSFSCLIANIYQKEKLSKPKFLDVSGSLCETGVDEYAYATLEFENKIIAKIGAAVRLNMENQVLIEGTKGNILIKDPWLPGKKSIVEIKTDDKYHKLFINSTQSIFANQINLVSEYILRKKKQPNFPANDMGRYY